MLGHVADALMTAMRHNLWRNFGDDMTRNYGNSGQTMSTILLEVYCLGSGRSRISRCQSLVSATWLTSVIGSIELS